MPQRLLFADPVRQRLSVSGPAAELSDSPLSQVLGEDHYPHLPSLQRRQRHVAPSEQVS